jgi:hypothetical protein
MRIQTLILETPKGRHRLCKDCYGLYASRKLNEDYEDAKDNVKNLHIGKVTDAYEIIKKKEKFLKDIKEGKI